MRELVDLGDRQRVHVGAQADGSRRQLVTYRPSLQHADDAGAADLRVRLDSERLQFALDDGRGADFFVAEFRMRVQVAADRDQVTVEVADRRDDGVGCVRKW